MDQSWEEREGTPPPWTAIGQQYHAARAERDALIANPPPIHGDARFMVRDEIYALETEAIAKNTRDYQGRNGCMILGNGFDLDTAECVSTVASTPPGHLLTLAATRSGKGTSHIVPNLLLYDGSMVVIDPKGENYALTHEARRKHGRVIRIDPFRVTKRFDPVSPYAGLNPMEFVEGESEARRLASLLLGDAPKGEGRFWHDEAINLLSAVILACASIGRNQINDVRDVLTAPNLSAGNEPSALANYLGALAEKSPEPGAQRRLQSFIGYSDKLQSSILATINAAMSIWDTPEISDAVSRTDLPFGDLKTDVATIYVVLPFDRMGDYGAFLRLMVGQFYQAMIKGAQTGGIPVACVIDEFPALGPMKELVRALAEVAGYGVRFWLFVQSLSQLKSLYPDDWNTILSQCGTLCVFGVTDGETVDWLGKELGQRTRAIAVPGISTGGSGRDADGALNVNGGINEAVQFAGTALLSPAEIREYLGIGSPWEVIFLSGKRPMLAMRITFHDDPTLNQMAGRFDDAPLLAIPNHFRDTEHWKGVPKGFKYGIRDSNDDV
ncbi:type IV secretory system conjugative DNA transfer family protein [Shimia sp. MMG029]|uniref:type IV secretory system conjugative DNA transfer family protein n=1 Tax=Shimia sp. MMG029 TaxID=3021978 RepID=UPI0022FECBD7|nr:type IV secretory system conjugative DNA transfer family protein [Shimia sp. MMG029]MDA5555799.1 type IV secretory system conjugative DNA transfer family protein [Shimia sp. MMG029]